MLTWGTVVFVFPFVMWLVLDYIWIFQFSWLSFSDFTTAFFIVICRWLVLIWIWIVHFSRLSFFISCTTRYCNVLSFLSFILIASYIYEGMFWLIYLDLLLGFYAHLGSSQIKSKSYLYYWRNKVMDLLSGFACNAFF